jgi:APA family basic amino acid/polyamine antiporter
VMILRVRRPDLVRPFRTPWVPFVPIMGIIVSLGLMASLNGVTWVRLIVWLIIGLVIYFTYGVKYSKVRNGAK